MWGRRESGRSDLRAFTDVRPEFSVGTVPVAISGPKGSLFFGRTRCAQVGHPARARARARAREHAESELSTVTWGFEYHSGAVHEIKRPLGEGRVRDVTGTY